MPRGRMGNMLSDTMDTVREQPLWMSEYWTRYSKP